MLLKGSLESFLTKMLGDLSQAPCQPNEKMWNRLRLLQWHWKSPIRDGKDLKDINQILLRTKSSKTVVLRGESMMCIILYRTVGNQPRVWKSQRHTQPRANQFENGFVSEPQRIAYTWFWMKQLITAFQFGRQIQKKQTADYITLLSDWWKSQFWRVIFALRPDGLLDGCGCPWAMNRCCKPIEAGYAARLLPQGIPVFSWRLSLFEVSGTRLSYGDGALMMAWFAEAD